MVLLSLNGDSFLQDVLGLSAFGRLASIDGKTDPSDSGTTFVHKIISSNLHTTRYDNRAHDVMGLVVETVFNDIGESHCSNDCNRRSRKG
jgi:hypothetical protein